MSNVNNNVQVNNNPSPVVDNSKPKVGTPDPNAVSALQDQLNGADPVNAAGGTPAAKGPGITAADMKNFMAEVDKFCMQQGISTTPSATGD